MTIAYEVSDPVLRSEHMLQRLRKNLKFSSSARREELSPRPARLMKKLSMRMPDCGPLGETLFDAKDLAIVAASFVKSPGGGKVETVFTLAIHRLF